MTVLRNTRRRTETAYSRVVLRGESVFSGASGADRSASCAATDRLARRGEITHAERADCSSLSLFLSISRASSSSVSWPR